MGDIIVGGMLETQLQTLKRFVKGIRNKKYRRP